MLCDECSGVFRANLQLMANGRRVCEPCTSIYYCVSCGLHTDNIPGERNEELICNDCVNHMQVVEEPDESITG